MMSPGMTQYPDHKLVTFPMKERVEIFMDGEKIVETRNAIKLLEDGHDPVIYVPKEDISSIEFQKFDDYHCPFKGRAKLFSIKHGPRKYENAAWEYEQPYEEFEELKDRVAFYPHKVQEIRITG